MVRAPKIISASAVSHVLAEKHRAANALLHGEPCLPSGREPASGDRVRGRLVQACRAVAARFKQHNLRAIQAVRRRLEDIGRAATCASRLEGGGVVEERRVGSRCSLVGDRVRWGFGKSMRFSWKRERVRRGWWRWTGAAAGGAATDGADDIRGARAVRL